MPEKQLTPENLNAPKGTGQYDIVTLLLVLTSLWPLLFLVSLISFAFLTSLITGSWPSYGNPDPKDVLNSVPRNIVWGIMFAYTPALFASVILGIYVSIKQRSILPLRWILYGLVCLFIVNPYLLRFQFPTLIEWILD